MNTSDVISLVLATAVGAFLLFALLRGGERL